MNELDITAFLTSGKLERFALNLSGNAEHKEIEGLLSEHLLIGEQLEKIYCTLDALEYIIAINPSPLLRVKIIEEIQVGLNFKFPILSRQRSVRNSRFSITTSNQLLIAEHQLLSNLILK